MQREAIGPTAMLAVVSLAGWTAFFTIRRLTHPEMRVLHVVLFGAWSFCSLAWLQAVMRRPLDAPSQYALLTAVALFCELIQFWTPGHNPELKGLAASLVGVILGREGFAWRLRPRRPMRLAPPS